MIRKYLIIVLSLMGFLLNLQGQDDPDGPVINAKGKVIEPLSESRATFLKLGLGNLFHQSSPNLGIGVEYMFRPNLSFEAVYGLRTPRINFETISDRLNFDNYHKFYLSFKMYVVDRLERDRYRPKGFEGFIPSYIAIEYYHARGNTTQNNDIAYTAENSFEYIEATIRKQVHGISIKSGSFLEITPQLEFECSYGLGILFFDRQYSFLNPIVNNRDFLDIILTSYNDRVMGKSEALNAIINFKLSYRIN